MQSEKKTRIYFAWWHLYQSRTALKSTKDVLELENMKTQYSVLRYRIDFCFDDYKLAIELDEFGHSDRDKTIK